MKLLARTVLALYLLMLAWLVLFKFSLDLSSTIDYQVRSLSLIPFINFSLTNSREMIYNLLVFIPFGLLLGVNLKQASFGRKLAFIFLFSFAAELIQFVFGIGIADITDIVTNTVGGFLGLLLYDVGKKYVDTKKLDRSIVITLLVLLIVLPSILLSHNLSYQSAPRLENGMRLPRKDY